MAFLPSRNQEELPTHGCEEGSVCAEHTQTVLCTPPRTALLTASCSTGTKGEHAAGQHQYMVKLTCPSLQEGALPSPSSERERSHTEFTDSGGSPIHMSQKKSIWLTPMKTKFLFFARNRLLFFFPNNGGFTRGTEVNETFMPLL